MNVQDIAMFAGTIFGAGGIGAVITKIWVQKRLDNKQDVNNFQTLFNEISKDVGRIRDEQAEERRQWAEERKQWSAERKELSDKFESVRQLLHKKEMEVIELTGKLNVMEIKLSAYDDTHSGGNKNITIKT